MQSFTHWYNNEHKYSQLNFVTPDERHMDEDKPILVNRQQTIKAAKAQNPNPRRWSSQEVRNCEPVGPTTLNPTKVPQEMR